MKNTEMLVSVQIQMRDSRPDFDETEKLYLARVVHDVITNALENEFIGNEQPEDEMRVAAVTTVAFDAQPFITNGLLRRTHTKTHNSRTSDGVSRPLTTFNDDELGFIQTAAAKILTAAARGDLDLNELADFELAQRGLDHDGKWVGLDKARRIYDRSRR